MVKIFLLSKNVPKMFKYLKLTGVCKGQINLFC